VLEKKRPKMICPEGECRKSRSSGTNVPLFFAEENRPKRKAQMKTLLEFEKLVQFAIKEEKKAQDLYKKMAKKANDPFIQAVLAGLHEEECGHEKKLENLLNSLKLSVS
jgi:rubrerythrin